MVYVTNNHVRSQSWQICRLQMLSPSHQTPTVGTGPSKAPSGTTLSKRLHDQLLQTLGVLPRQQLPVHPQAQPRVQVTKSKYRGASQHPSPPHPHTAVSNPHLAKKPTEIPVHYLESTMPKPNKQQQTTAPNSSKTASYSQHNLRTSSHTHKPALQKTRLL